MFLKIIKIIFQHEAKLDWIGLYEKWLPLAPQQQVKIKELYKGVLTKLNHSLIFLRKESLNMRCLFLCFEGLLTKSDQSKALLNKTIFATSESWGQVYCLLGSFVDENPSHLALAFLGHVTTTLYCYGLRAQKIVGWAPLVGYFWKGPSANWHSTISMHEGWQTPNSVINEALSKKPFDNPFKYPDEIAFTATSNDAKTWTNLI